MRFEPALPPILINMNKKFSNYKPLGSLTLGDCDDDYCTGCEPGCGLYDVPFQGPHEAPDIGPEELTLDLLMRRNYERITLTLFGLPPPDSTKG